jgi:hypothetical protein
MRRRIRKQNDAEQYLLILSICHYIMGGLTSLIGLVFPGIYVFMGFCIMVAPSSPKNGGGEAVAGLMVALIGLFFMLLGVAYGSTFLIAGYSISKRKNYIFTLVAAGLACMWLQPFSIALGIFTFVVLLSDNGKELYGRGPPSRRYDDDDDWDEDDDRPSRNGRRDRISEDQLDYRKDADSIPDTQRDRFKLSDD